MIDEELSKFTLSIDISEDKEQSGTRPTRAAEASATAISGSGVAKLYKKCTEPSLNTSHEDWQAFERMEPLMEGIRIVKKSCIYIVCVFETDVLRAASKLTTGGRGCHGRPSVRSFAGS